MDNSADRSAPTCYCPSAQPDWEGGVVLGVVLGTAQAPRLGHLEVLEPVTDELMALAGPVAPTEVFRIAAPCLGTECTHFDGKDCRLVQRLVTLLPPVIEVLLSCALRPSCRWWQQRGRAACLRCPQVVTDSNYAEMGRIATPGNGASTPRIPADATSDRA
jgi:hypothetical protein